MKKAQLEAWGRIKDAIKACGPDGLATLEIRDIDSRADSSGRTHYLDARVWRIGEHGAPDCSEWLTYNLCLAFGYRFNKKREALGMGGYGYSREQQLASHIVLQAGHPIRVASPGSSFAPRGWFPAEPGSPKDLEWRKGKGENA